MSHAKGDRDIHSTLSGSGLLRRRFMALALVLRPFKSFELFWA